MIIELFAILGVVVVGALVARQNGQIRKLENDLYALRMAFLAHREKIGEVPAAAATPAAEPTAQSAPPASATAETAPADVAPPAEAAAGTPPSAPDDLAAVPAVAAAAAETAAGDAGPWAAGTTGGGPAPEKPRRDIETALGTRWAVWVGGLALALGAVFLIRYSIEAGVFGPRLRLSLAALLGIVLAGGGEFLRRNSSFKLPVEGLQNAYVPAILTAAGAFTLFGTVYAAHAVYGFIGPTLAFALLGAIAMATLAMALIHGQALGGVGLLGALATPMLVASEAPNAWVLFGYLAIVLAANTAVARLRAWRPVSALGFVGMGCWVLMYMGISLPPSMAVILFATIVMLGALAVVWLGGWRGATRIAPGVDWSAIAVSVFVGLAAMALMVDANFSVLGGRAAGAAVLAIMVAIALWRRPSLPLLHGAGAVAVLAHVQQAVTGRFIVDFPGGTLEIEGFPAVPAGPYAAASAGLLAALFLAAGAWSARRLAAAEPPRAANWAAWAAVVPIAIAGLLWVAFGNLNVDYAYAAMTLLAALALVAAAEWVAAAEASPRAGGPAVSFLVAGAFAGLVAALHMAFGELWTTMLCGATAALAAVATMRRSYPVLGWLAAAAVAVVVLRVAIDPTIVGTAALSTRPVLNQLLAGYGLPALSFAFAAWQLARTTGGRPRLVMEAGGALFALLTAAMLTRHAMNGGVIHAAAPTLGEQAIYTLIALGGGAILIALDARAPSPVFRIGSIAIGVVSAVFVALQHFLFLNPLFTEESTGSIAFFNLLLLGYLMPAVAAAGLALYARGKRPRWYVAGLALVAATLAFAYATLSVRRLFKGEFIGLWKGMEQIETYAYSALWLAMGVVILAIGVRLKSQMLRLASAALVVLAVGKAFLIDMSELEGVLRALSFIGLGAVLIGIGLFYQRMLVKAARAEAS